jgi:hypothetical protein
MALCAAVPFHEHARISTNLRTLSLIYAGLVAGEHYYAPIVDGVLVHFAATLAQGKAAGRAEPLRELVVALRARKELVDGS